MPSRNVIKEFAEDQFYHVYNRGVDKRDIFLDDDDYSVFLGLLKKYLTGKDSNKTHRHSFKSLKGQVELHSYCLMPNHFHLLFYQKDMDAITKLMRRVNTGYVMYFNGRYGRVGALFQGKLKAAHVNADDYLHHISRYIHMNPEDYQKWKYSSLGYYLGKKKTPEWLKTKRILSLFYDDPKEYLQFIEDYHQTKRELKLLKWQLADSPHL
jgi:putative transposase